MNRIIIENRSSLEDVVILDCVKDVIKNGRVSNHGKQYCYGSRFKFKAFGHEMNIMIFTDLNKCSDRFVAVDDNHKTKPKSPTEMARMTPLVVSVKT